MKISTASALLALGQIYTVEALFGGIADPQVQFLFAPYEANSKNWTDAVKASNATGKIKFVGRDVSKPWPGSTLGDWSVEATALDLLPKPLSLDLKIVAPSFITKKNVNGGAVVDAREDWTFCAWKWALTDAQNLDRMNNPDYLDSKPDGSCEQWISSNCTRALEKWAQTAYTVRSEGKGYYDLKYSCKSFALPQECKGVKAAEYNTPSAEVGSVLPLKFINGTTTWQDSINPADGDDANATHQQWLALTRDIHIVLTNFGHLSDNASSTDVDPGFSKLTCVRSKDKNFNSKPGSGDDGENGGDKGGDDKDSAASASAAPGFQLAFVAVSAVFLSLML